MPKLCAKGALRNFKNSSNSSNLAKNEQTLLVQLALNPFSGLFRDPGITRKSELYHLYIYIYFFFPQILDEVQRIMRYIRQNSNQPPKGPNRAYIFMEDELFDLTTMAMEYFKENIEPTLPEITYFGADFLDFTTSFASKSYNIQGVQDVLEIF